MKGPAIKFLKYLSVTGQADCKAADGISDQFLVQPAHRQI